MVLKFLPISKSYIENKSFMSAWRSVRWGSSGQPGQAGNSSGKSLSREKHPVSSALNFTVENSVVAAELWQVLVSLGNWGTEYGGGALKASSQHLGLHLEAKE